MSFKSIASSVVMAMVLFCAISYAQKNQAPKYPALSESQNAIVGDIAKWDSNKTHTLSVVEANKDGYKYWGYYGLCYYGGDPALRKSGLARSNDLIHWEKYDGNPIIPNDCRWPSVIISDNMFYMFYAEYNENNDSRIVMLTSRDGIHFGDKTEVVAREVGAQNQNPNIFLDKKDGRFYLSYYHGVERSNDKPLVGREKIDKKAKFNKAAKNYWQIRLLKSKTLAGLKNAKPKTLLTSDYTIASPSIINYNNKYYLLIESIKEGKWDNKWVTLGYVSDKVDGKYKLLTNNPVLPDNDACAFQHVFDGQLYIFYSHCIDPDKWNWLIKMVKAVK
jgi:hypothetical protein